MDARHKSHSHPIRIFGSVREPLRTGLSCDPKTWMAGTSPAMTILEWTYATASLAFSALLRSLASRNFLRSRIDFGVTSTSSSSSI